MAHRSLVALVLLTACSHTAPAVHVDGVVIQAVPDPDTHLDAYTPADLFHLAGEAERAGDAARAERSYRRLIELFPTSDFAGPARFNLGLLLEAREHFAAALEVYDGIAVTERESASPELRRLWLDAQFRRTVMLGKLNAWWDAVAVLDRVLEQAWLDDFDRLEAMVGRGIGIQEAGDAAGAELAFAHVLRFYREATARERLMDLGLVAEAAFRMGVIAAERFRGVELAFPIELLRTRLEEKCQHLLAAQSRFLRAISHGDRHTVAASGYSIGEMYEQLYDAITTLAAPTELTEEQVEVYNEEVRGKLRVLLEKAMSVYEKSLLASRSTTSAKDWIARIEKAVARLRGMLVNS